MARCEAAKKRSRKADKPKRTASQAKYQKGEAGLAVHRKADKKYIDSITKLAGQCGVKGGIVKVNKWVKEQGGKKAVVNKADKVAA